MFTAESEKEKKRQGVELIELVLARAHEQDDDDNDDGCWWFFAVKAKKSEKTDDWELQKKSINAFYKK